MRECGCFSTTTLAQPRRPRHRYAVPRTLRVCRFCEGRRVRLEFAVGTRVTSRPPHRSVRAQFGHSACMGLCLSRRHQPISVVLCHSILLFDLRRKHSLVPTAYLHRRRAQRRSRTALLQRRRRLALDGREHGGRLVWGFVCQGGINPFLSSFVIPFFCSTCAASILSSRPHICIAVAHSGGQGRRFFSAAEGLSLTDASTAAGLYGACMGPCLSTRHQPLSVVLSHSLLF